MNLDISYTWPLQIHNTLFIYLPNHIKKLVGNITSKDVELLPPTHKRRRGEKSLTSLGVIFADKEEEIVGHQIM